MSLQIDINLLTVVQIVRNSMLVPTLLDCPKKVSQRKLPIKYDDFIFGTLKHLSTIKKKQIPRESVHRTLFPIMYVNIQL